MKSVVFILLLAAAVRFPGLGARSLWFDEALSGLIARLDRVQILANVAGSSHPPGYYYLLHLCRALGRSEFALRFPSAWFSLVAVALVARLGHDLFGRREARLAALLMALAPFQVYYAQEARMYGVVIVASSVVMWSFARGVQEGRMVWWILYALAATLGLYVHYYVALVAFALHLWLLLDRRLLGRRWVALITTDGLIALAFAPQMMQFRIEAGEFLGRARWRVVPHPLEPLRTLHYLVFGHIMPLWVVPVGLFLIIALLSIGGLWILRRRDKVAGMLFLAVFCPIGVALLVSFLFNPVYVERSFAVVTPALVLLLARGILVVPRRSPVPYLSTALVVLMVGGVILHHLGDDPAKPSIREALQVVSRGADAADRILHLQDASYLPALYYVPERAGVLVDAGQRLWLSPRVYALLGGRVIEPGEHVPGERMWLVMMPGYVGPSQREFLNAVRSDYRRLQDWKWGADLQVWLGE